MTLEQAAYMLPAADRYVLDLYADESLDFYARGIGDLIAYSWRGDDAGGMTKTDLRSLTGLSLVTIERSLGLLLGGGHIELATGRLGIIYRLPSTGAARRAS